MKIKFLFLSIGLIIGIFLPFEDFFLISPKNVENQWEITDVIDGRGMEVELDYLADLSKEDARLIAEKTGLLEWVSIPNPIKEGPDFLSRRRVEWFRILEPVLLDEGFISKPLNGDNAGQDIIDAVERSLN